jgi:toxin ParE1/3/4
MRRVHIHEAASREAIEAAAWYELKRPGLGVEFQRAIETALDLLSEDVVPLTSVHSAAKVRGVKRLILKRFPFDVVVVDRICTVVAAQNCELSREIEEFPPVLAQNSETSRIPMFSASVSPSRAETCPTKNS